MSVYALTIDHFTKRTTTLGRKQRSVIEWSYTRSVQRRVDEHDSGVFLARRPLVKW